MENRKGRKEKKKGELRSDRIIPLNYYVGKFFYAGKLFTVLGAQCALKEPALRGEILRELVCTAPGGQYSNYGAAADIYLLHLT